MSDSLLQYLVHLEFGLCLFMTGLIWLIQLVHYPSFHFIKEDRFIEYSAFHSGRITMIVLPVMLFELVFSFLMFFISPMAVPSEIHLKNIVALNFTGVLILWASTFFLSVPCHSKLATKKDEKTIDRLVNTNWIRTIVWSLRSALLFFLIQYF